MAPLFFKRPYLHCFFPPFFFAKNSQKHVCDLFHFFFFLPVEPALLSAPFSRFFVLGAILLTQAIFPLGSALFQDVTKETSLLPNLECVWFDCEVRSVHWRILPPSLHIYGCGFSYCISAVNIFSSFMRRARCSCICFVWGYR